MDRSADRKDFSFSRQRYHTFGQTSQEMGSGYRPCIFRPPHVVDFAVFSRDYWPKLHPRAKGISSALAFMEIIGVIKGSATRHSGSANFRPLSREEYEKMGHRTFSMAVDRERLYDLYERYEKLKRGLGDLDDVDRARSVLDALSSNADLRRKIENAFDEVYVDGRVAHAPLINQGSLRVEIQDQRLLEIEMLLQIVRNPIAVHFGKHCITDVLGL